MEIKANIHVNNSQNRELSQDFETLQRILAMIPKADTITVNIIIAHGASTTNNIEVKDGI